MAAAVSGVSNRNSFRGTPLEPVLGGSWQAELAPLKMCSPENLLVEGIRQYTSWHYGNSSTDFNVYLMSLFTVDEAPLLVIFVYCGFVKSCIYSLNIGQKVDESVYCR